MKINDWVFVHAGITPENVKGYNSIESPDKLEIVVFPEFSSDIMTDEAQIVFLN